MLGVCFLGWSEHKNFNLLHDGGACGQVKVNDQGGISARIYNAKAAIAGSEPWVALIRVDYGEYDKLFEVYLDR